MFKFWVYFEQPIKLKSCNTNISSIKNFIICFYYKSVAKTLKVRLRIDCGKKNLVLSNKFIILRMLNNVFY